MKRTLKLKKKLALWGGAAGIGVLSVAIGIFAFGNLGRAEASLTSGTIQVTSVHETLDQDLLAGTATMHFSVGLTDVNGANTNGVTVHLQLLQGGTVKDESVTAGDILHDQTRTFWLTPSQNDPAGAYTLAVVVDNADGSMDASFPDLATVTLGGSAVGTGTGGNGTGTSTSTPTSTTGGTGTSTSTSTSTATSTGSMTPAQGSVAVVRVDRIKDNLIAGNTTTITANLISANGANTNDVTVHVQLTQDGTVMDEAVYHDVNILHELPQGFVLTTRTDLAPGTYTIAVSVNNADGTVNASFPNLGTIVIIPEAP